MGRERIFAAEWKRKRRTNGGFCTEMISFRHAIRGGAMIIYELPFPGVLMMNWLVIWCRQDMEIAGIINNNISIAKLC